MQKRENYKDIQNPAQKFRQVSGKEWNWGQESCQRSEVALLCGAASCFSFSRSAFSTSSPTWLKGAQTLPASGCFRVLWTWAIRSEEQGGRRKGHSWVTGNLSKLESVSCWVWEHEGCRHKGGWLWFLQRIQDYRVFISPFLYYFCISFLALYEPWFSKTQGRV